LTFYDWYIGKERDELRFVLFYLKNKRMLTKIVIFRSENIVVSSLSLSFE